MKPTSSTKEAILSLFVQCFLSSLQRILFIRSFYQDIYSAIDTRLKNCLLHPQAHPAPLGMITILPLALIGMLAAAVSSTPFHPKRQADGQQVIFRSDLKQGEGQSPEFKDLFRTQQKAPSSKPILTLANPTQQSPTQPQTSPVNTTSPL